MIQGNSDYRVINQLGKGNYGVAFLVERTKDQVLCVIKQIDMSDMSEDEKKDTLKEASTLQMLKHSNITKYYEHYKTKKGKLCIVMEYAGGGDLNQVIQSATGPISEDQILIWLGQMASALSYVHSKNIIHRDIKAQNVLLSAQNDIKLADFGIARVLASTKEKASTFIGTPYYLAPELVDSKPYAVAVDIWSLGVLIYQLCTLKPPFDSENLALLYLKISRGQFPPLPGHYSKELRSLVREMLTVDPSKRITAAQILEKPLLKGRVEEMSVDAKPFKERLSIQSNNNLNEKSNNDAPNIRFYSPQHNMELANQQKGQKQQQLAEKIAPIIEQRKSNNIISKQINNKNENESQSPQNQQEQQLSEPPKIPRMERMEGVKNEREKHQNSNSNNNNKADKEQQDKNSDPDKKQQFRVRSPVPKIVSPSSRFAEVKPRQSEKQIIGQKVQPQQQPQQQQQPKQVQNIPGSTPTSSSNSLEGFPAVAQVPQEIPNASSNFTRLNSPGTRLPFLNHQQPPQIGKKVQHGMSQQGVPTVGNGQGGGIGGQGGNNVNNAPGTPQSNQIKRNYEKQSFSKPSCFMKNNNNNNELPSPKMLGNNSNLLLRPTSAALVGIVSNGNLLRKQQQIQSFQMQQAQQELQGIYEKSEQSPHQGQQQVVPLSQPPQLYKKELVGLGDVPMTFDGASSLAKRREKLKSAQPGIITTFNHNNINLQPGKVNIGAKNNINSADIPSSSSDNPQISHSPVQLQPLQLHQQLQQEQEEQQQQQVQQQKKKNQFLIKKSNVNTSQQNLIITNLNNRMNDPDDIIAIMEKNEYVQKEALEKEHNESKEDQEEQEQDTNSCEATQQIKIISQNNSTIQDLKTAKKLNLISNPKQIASQPSLEYDKNDIIHPKRVGSGSFVVPAGISPSQKILQKKDQLRKNSTNTTEEDVVESNKGEKQQGQQQPNHHEHLAAMQKNYYSHDYDKQSKIERKIIVNDPFQEIKRKRKNTGDVSQKEQIMSENETEERGSMPRIKEKRGKEVEVEESAADVQGQEELKQQHDGQGNGSPGGNDKLAGQLDKKLDEFNHMMRDSTEEEYKDDFLEEGEDIDQEDDSEYFNDSRVTNTFRIDESAISGASYFKSQISHKVNSNISKNSNESIKAAVSGTHANTPPTAAGGDGNTPESNKSQKSSNSFNSMNEQQQPLSHFQQSSQQQLQQKQQSQLAQSQPDRVQTLREQLEKEIGTIHFSKVYKLAVELLSTDSSPSSKARFQQSLKVMFPSITKEFLQRYTALFYSLVLFDQHN